MLKLFVSAVVEVDVPMGTAVVGAVRPRSTCIEEALLNTACPGFPFRVPSPKILNSAKVQLLARPRIVPVVWT